MAVRMLIVEIDNIAQIILDRFFERVERVIETHLIVFVQRQAHDLHCTIRSDNRRGSDEVSGTSVLSFLIA